MYSVGNCKGGDRSNWVCVAHVLISFSCSCCCTKIRARHLASFDSNPICSSSDVSFMMSASFAFILLSMLRAREATCILRNSRRCLLVRSLPIFSLISGKVGCCFLTGPLFCNRQTHKPQSFHDQEKNAIYHWQHGIVWCGWLTLTAGLGAVRVSSASSLSSISISGSICNAPSKCFPFIL